jgi:hypothetical protein
MRPAALELLHELRTDLTEASGDDDDLVPDVEQGVVHRFSRRCSDRVRCQLFPSRRCSCRSVSSGADDPERGRRAPRPAAPRAQPPHRIPEAVARGEPGLREGLQANAWVAYTALARPEAWRAAPDAFARDGGLPDRPVRGVLPDAVPRLEPGGQLRDHGLRRRADAVAAIRWPDVSVSSPKAVIQEFRQLHGPQAVAGASGWISLDATGSPIDKAVAIVEVVPHDSTRFLHLSSPSGTPCRPGTAPC